MVYIGVDSSVLFYRSGFEIWPGQCLWCLSDRLALFWVVHYLLVCGSFVALYFYFSCFVIYIVLILIVYTCTLASGCQISMFFNVDNK